MTLNEWTKQWERFRSLFERTPDAYDFIIYSAVGGVLDPDHLSAYWRDVLDGLNLPHVRFHDIRHTFATRAIEQGVDVATVAGLLGRADVSTTTHYYLHPREASMHRAMAAIEPVGKKCAEKIGRPRRTDSAGNAGRKTTRESSVTPRHCRKR